ncbi:MAG: hypothetical protein BWK73_35930 [Thiothrix lacustris]|uniref:Relaxosome protein TraY n=1 Tax=Thiothrix lacustris TaxID=525917 RepID=A0A1Y1QG49_9GAMM|nr:MAG: hypothetical protein BWK73_35930 [Thiothrix lacustris]
MDKKAISPFPLRLEPDLRKVLEDSARKNERSLQAEIAARLLESTGLKSDSDKSEEARIRRIAQEVFLELGKAGIHSP